VSVVNKSVIRRESVLCSVVTMRRSDSIRSRSSWIPKICARLRIAEIYTMTGKYEEAFREYERAKVGKAARIGWGTRTPCRGG